MSRPESLDNKASRIAPSDLLKDLSKRDGLATNWLVVSFVVAAVAIFSRSPGLLTHAQFFAEDGKDWFAQAYNLGWLHSLTIPYMGYLSTVQRLGGGLAVLVPFQWAPLMMALVGLVFQAAPVPLLLSSQFRRLAPLPTRIAFAAAYIGIPNQREIHVVLTNSQWHLAMMLGLIAFAEVPDGAMGKVLELALVCLGAVSGPFGIMLAPLVAIYWYVRRQRWTAIVLGILSVGATLQFFVILKNYSQRPTGSLGASVPLFIRLVGGNCFVGTLLGSHPFGLILPLACSACMLAIGIGLCVYCARSLSAEIRLFFAYCFLIFLAEIRVPSKVPLWHALVVLAGQRYMFFPSLPLLFAVLWCAGYARNRAARTLGGALTLVLCIGICLDWHIPSFPTIDLNQQAAILNAAKPGEHVVLPIYPPGWFMDLVKR